LLYSLTENSVFQPSLESMARHHSYFLCFWPLAKCNWRPELAERGERTELSFEVMNPVEMSGYKLRKMRLFIRSLDSLRGSKNFHS